MDGSVSMLRLFLIYNFISKPNPPDLPRGYPILQHGPSISAAVIFSGEGNSIDLSESAWRLGQTGATKRRQLPEVLNEFSGEV